MVGQLVMEKLGNKMEEKEKKVYFKKTHFIKAEYNNKWKVDDKRRIIFYVEFSDGSVWYPKDEEIKIIEDARKICFNNNIKYPNLDNENESDKGD